MKKLSLFFISLAAFASFSQGTRLLRQPSMSSSEVVFVYGADLWKASLQGGNATRLTSNIGLESDPHFSKDGNWIAFTAQYDGNSDVYLVAAKGGEPKRLTYHPAGDFVQGWTPDGKIIFRSGREGRPTQTNKFYTISTEGGMLTCL
jgi:tricorn protease